MTPDGAKRTAAIPNEARGPLNGPATLSPAARCISRGAFGSMLPIGNSSGNQIIQAPGIVVIRNKMIHEARIVHTDGRPHVGTGILGYMGDSRGWWQGQTLVVETTNFNENGGVNRAFTRDARMTERFTRVDARTLRYEVTVDDPRTWSKPWTVAIPLEQDPSFYLFELPATKGITGACARCSEEHDSKRSNLREPGSLRQRECHVQLAGGGGSVGKRAGFQPCRRRPAPG